MLLRVLAPRFTGLSFPIVQIITAKQLITCCLIRVVRQLMLRARLLSDYQCSATFRLHCSVVLLVPSGDFRIVPEDAFFSSALNFLTGSVRIISPYPVIILLACPH